MKERPKKYLWANPHDWLKDKPDFDMLWQLVVEFVDGDQIQDLFESGMEEDGYFKEIFDCPGHSYDDGYGFVEESCECTGCGVRHCDDCLYPDWNGDPYCEECNVLGDIT